MWRRRRVLSIALLLIVLGAGGGYWRTREPNLVLHTAAVGSGGFNAGLDEWTSRLYVLAFGSGTSSIVNTRTGVLVHPSDIAAQQTGGPVNRLLPHLVTGSPDGQFVWIVDDTTLGLRHQVPVNVSDTLWFLDDPTDRFYVVDQAGTISVVDVQAGRILAQAQGCSPGSANAVESHPEGHLFLACGGGGTEMHDGRTGRLLRSINGGGQSDCTCRRIADDLTGRVFLPGRAALDVLDARTGAIMRTLPIRVWDGGSFEFDAHMGAVADLDPRTGKVAVAPYTAPRSGQPERAVLLLDGRTGTILHRWQVPANPLAVLVNPLTHHLLVASAGPADQAGQPLGDGTLSVLDLGSGAILRQVEVGLLPGELFADRRAKRLLVMNRTTALDGTGLSRSYPDGWWPESLRWLKRSFGWLPFTAPAAPPPPSDITVSLLDLTKL